MSMQSVPDQQPPRRGYEGFEGTVHERASASVPSWSAANGGEEQPNIVMILIDDMGYSDLGPFGSEIETPNIDALADGGVRFSNFHTLPVCSPSRAAFLTGMNPHRAGFGTLSHGDPGYPGYRYTLPDDAPTLAERLRATGYATYMVGKWHLTIDSQMHDGADRSSWPTQKGFDRYFGSMDGFTTMYSPHRLIRDNSVVVEGVPEDVYLTDLLADEALQMVRALRANDPVKPFFLYFAHTAVHAPIQAKPEHMERVAGQYAPGWDEMREARFARQKDIGLFPESAQCAPTQEAAWADLDDDDKQLFERHMEAYAASVMAIDESVGRLVAELRERGELERTVFVIASDNGGTNSAGARGTRSYFSSFIHRGDLPADWNRDVDLPIDKIGDADSRALYPSGWAQCSNTPLRNYKGTTYDGGIRVPLIVSGWPDRDGDAGIRHQYAFMTDLYPTLLEIAGADPSAPWRGSTPPEIDGLSLSQVIVDEQAPTPRHEQYFENMGRRALYSDGFKLVSSRPGRPTLDDSAWELYDIAHDPAEIHNLRDEHPEKVRELAERWRELAWWNTVYPIDDDGSLRQLRPEWYERYSRPVTLRPGIPTLERFRSARLTVLRDFVVDATFDWRIGDEGVLIAHGDQGGGYSLSIEPDGTVLFAYNAYGEMHRAHLVPAAEGTRNVRLTASCGDDFTWTFAVTEGTNTVGLGPVPTLLGTAPFTGISVGLDFGSPVDRDRSNRQGVGRYSGTDLAVTITPGKRASVDHERLVRIEQRTDRLND